MNPYEKTIQAKAKELLETGEVTAVLGFRKGSLPMTTEPYLATTPDEAAMLCWDTNCRLNLATYLHKGMGKVAVVAKGCDSRNIVGLVVENRINRDDVVIIGVPCTGMIDPKKAADAAAGEILAAKEDGDNLILATASGEERIAKTDLLRRNCALCTHRNPVIADYMVADAVPEQTGIDRYADIREIEAKPSDEKWAFFDQAFSACTRCYACKNACPLCYCPTCFVDESSPQWVGKGTDPVDVRTYHMLRAIHCAGRCTECGACESACPMGVPVQLLTRKMEKTATENWGLEAGLTTETRPAQDTFRLDDPEAFIL
ncbi:4Fe-4S dicluster domain-containing protein [Desulfoluna spongiiphila]|uniref:4Fe-4S dicluster domain-containing protein n=1 Tax=Desulfoluna spongiiphila TaxID=419481 RepID=A0A1G5FDW4_9BACT|nr:4Fe-4S dicluster domain-containing protein [Desulfoluna spongiiphila]SCY37331.1 4Fe-4S dicluster domain-containing protein [Desulfoluna spongiiphila]VVS95656.1 alpha-helical ferredoxin [Desulfoluna spongiiphila]